ncbi:hypothetical protein KY336_00930 [Candidatus Woesearchaeota archaeon]|nr:hypothetical protein [Candidatus Woesearchaeota archaeon]
MLKGFKILDYPEDIVKEMVGRYKSWHYVCSRDMWSAPKDECRKPIPDGMLQTIFNGYKAVCAIRHHDREDYVVSLKLCAVPSRGGPYLILDNEFPEDFLPFLESEEGLKRILANALLSDIGQLERRGLEIVERPDQPCVFCDEKHIEEGLRDKNTDEVYCGPLCFLYNREL